MSSVRDIKSSNDLHAMTVENDTNVHTHNASQCIIRAAFVAKCVLRSKMHIRANSCVMRDVRS